MDGQHLRTRDTIRDRDMTRPLPINTPLPIAIEGGPTPWVDSQYVELLHRKLRALENLRVIGGRVIKTESGVTIQMDD
jgi:hypothetical protein